jgi:hypothetical protein
MKKIFLLAALLLSSAAQAETWVCAGLSSEKAQTIYTFIREEGYFAVTVSIQGDEDIKVNQEILAEDDDLVIVGTISLGELGGAVLRMINKKTNNFAEDGVFISDKYTSVRQEGVCTKI